MVDRNVGVPPDRHIKFRIGINLGDVIIQGDDVFGDDVNMASRLVELAPPGGIACSAGIRHQIGTKLDIDFADQGVKTVKNITQPIHVYFITPVKEGKADIAPAQSGPARHYMSDKPSVAVLPFANMSDDPEQDYFSDGITEDIITDLSKVSELSVLSRNAVFQHKGKAVNLEEMARQLGVAYLIDGSVRKAGSRVRITAQLIEGASGGHIWADRYDRNFTDIFALQDEITRTIVEQLKVKLLPRERQAIAQAPTTSVEAYTYYLRGREHFHRGSRSSYQLAKRMFAKAIELDPLYARAYAGLADCDSFLYMDYSEDVAADMLKNSETALELEKDLVEAHASRGLALSIARRYAEAEREFAVALGARSQPVRVAVLLWPLVLCARPIRTDCPPLGTSGGNQAGRLSGTDPAEPGLCLARPAKGRDQGFATRGRAGGARICAEPRKPPARLFHGNRSGQAGRRGARRGVGENGTRHRTRGLPYAI